MTKEARHRSFPQQPLKKSENTLMLHITTNQLGAEQEKKPHSASQKMKNWWDLPQRQRGTHWLTRG